MENFQVLEESCTNFVDETSGLLKLLNARSNSRSNEVVDAKYRELLEICSTTTSSQEGIRVPAESFSSTSSSSPSLSEQFESSPSIRLGPPSSESLPPEDADVSENRVIIEERRLEKFALSRKERNELIKNLKSIQNRSVKERINLAFNQLHTLRSSSSASSSC